MIRFFAATFFLVATAACAADATAQRAFLSSKSAARYEEALKKAGVPYQVSTDDKGGHIFVMPKEALEAKTNDPALVEFEAWQEKRPVGHE